jgi:hypothetical protein
MASFLATETVLESAEMPSNRVSFIMDGNVIDMRLFRLLCASFPRWPSHLVAAAHSFQRKPSQSGIKPGAKPIGYHASGFPIYDLAQSQFPCFSLEISPFC